MEAQVPILDKGDIWSLCVCVHVRVRRYIYIDTVRRLIHMETIPANKQIFKQSSMVSEQLVYLSRNEIG